jgi:hypothetical protein
MRSPIVEIIAILLSPVTAVCVTLWWQRRKEKRDAKIRLFTTLMAFRKSYPLSYEWANALNLIDVIFADSPTVLDRWHKYYDNLQDPSAPSLSARNSKYLELMSEMAKALGYTKLQQTDIDKFYIAEAHGAQADINAEFQREFLRVLKNTSRFETSPISPPSDAKTLADIPPLTPAPKKDDRPLGVRIFDPPESK